MLGSDVVVDLEKTEKLKNGRGGVPLRTPLSKNFEERTQVLVRLLSKSERFYS